MFAKAVCCAVLISAALPSAFAVAASKQLNELFDAYQAWRLAEMPEYARAQGDYSSAEQVTDDSLAAIERRHQDEQRFLARLHEINRAELSPADALNYDLFERERRESIEGHRFRMFLAPMGGRFGPQIEVPQLHERVRFRDYADYENYLKRVEATPKEIGHIIERMKLGLREGRTPPRVCIQGVQEQFDALLRDGLRVLATPLDYTTADLSDDQRAALRTRFESVSYPALHAAMGKLGEFVAKEYVPNCRVSIAATDLPDGVAFYAHQLKVMTTTELSAKEIHEIGLSEVARLRAEMLGVIRRSDFLQRKAAAGWGDEQLFREFIHYLRTDPRFYFERPEELLAAYREICKRVDAELPKLFRTLPRLPYGVREIPAFMAPHQTTAYYQQGDIRNAQPGYFYANTFKLDQRPKYEMIALAMHEAVPGHHLQIALAQELSDAPEFRKDSWVTAFGEGWALYSERLGLEVGLYTDPYDDFGRLLYEMWRACRLVVDPGMHALGWSRDKAVQFMLDNTALSELNIGNEIDRYIAWPGQATAYKLGELKIRELRARAERELGAKFDLRDFHDMLLGAGTLPLTILEARVAAWIDATKSS